MSNQYNLTGKVALITGAGQGIGAATAIEYAKSGADVVLCARRTDKLEKVAEKVRALGRKALPVPLDVLDIDSINNAVAQATEEFGHIDVLVNCAGIWRPSTLIDMDVDLWDRIVGTNLRGATFMAKAVAKHMVENGVHGTILFISSQAAKNAEYGNSAYGSAKLALHLLTQVMALELSEYDINTVAICPGSIYTEMLQDVFNERGPLNGMTPDEFRDSCAASIPQKRLGTPEEIAQMLAYLGSDDASYITGVNITIAGGQTII
ncbi:MAG: SDR family oxidoreductase [Eubacterium sp.]|nr:SDR family oxidoreductase [Eubacterium sp.]